MSDLRTAAKEALWAFQYHVEQTWPTDRSTVAIAALRAALAQQAEPVEPVEPVSNEALRLAGLALIGLAEHDQHCDVFDLDDQGRHKACTCGLTNAIAVITQAEKSALAQQDEPEGSVCARCGALAFDPLVPQQAEPVGPVYWEVRCTAHPKWMRVDEQQFDEYVSYGWEGQRLFTAPPQRQPLTEEEIVEAVREAGLDWHAGWTLDERAPNRFATLARAVERAHGIVTCGDTKERA